MRGARRRALSITSITPISSITPANSIASIALAAALFGFAAPALAGAIADENARPGAASDWMATNDGTATGAGVADVYPAAWSVARGDTIRLKVRSTTDYDLRVYRLGFYAGAGSREIALLRSLPASPQPYPSADATYGIAEAGWSDSVAIATDATWTPGVP